MNNVTVDPEMKRRVMSAVSAAIKEQSNGASVTKIPVHVKDNSDKKVKAEKADAGSAGNRKKAKKTPVALVSSIAAGVLVIAGAILVVNYLNNATKAAAEINAHDHVTEVGGAEMEIASETASLLKDGVDNSIDNSLNISTTAGTGHFGVTNSDDIETDDIETDKTLTVDIGSGKVQDAEAAEESVVIGDARLDCISRTLPFDIKGTGHGNYSKVIAEEVIFGINGEKVLIYTAPEGTDIFNTLFHATKGAGIDGTTPAGVFVKLYRIPFGNVYDVEDSASSADINAAVFTKDGKAYMVVFSDVQPQDVILKVADAV